MAQIQFTVDFNQIPRCIPHSAESGTSKGYIHQVRPGEPVIAYLPRAYSHNWTDSNLSPCDIVRCRVLNDPNRLQNSPWLTPPTVDERVDTIIEHYLELVGESFPQDSDTVFGVKQHLRKKLSQYPTFAPVPRSNYVGRFLMFQINPVTRDHIGIRLIENDNLLDYQTIIFSMEGWTWKPHYARIYSAFTIQLIQRKGTDNGDTGTKGTESSNS